MILTLSCFSLSITPSSCYSDTSEWILDTCATYHICPKWELFASFGKIDGGVMSFGDGHTCYIKGIDTVRVNLFDGTMRELKDVRYIPCMMKKLVSDGALKAERLRGTLEEGILNMSSGSVVVLKRIRCNNFY